MRRSEPNPVVLVTGGAERVGCAIALRLAGAGFDVAITYRRSAAEARVVVKRIEALGRRGLAIRADFARASAPGEVFKKFTGRFGRLDALVNNASIFEPSAIGKVTAAQFDRQINVNARAPLMLIQAFAPLLGARYREDRPGSAGRIVSFIDIHVMGQPLKGFVAYNAGKAALQEITMTAAMELAPRVTVNAVAPGVVAWAESYTAGQRKAYMRRVPLARAGTPEDAAAAVLWLVTEGSYCTGQIIKLDGGRLLT